MISHLHWKSSIGTIRSVRYELFGLATSYARDLPAHWHFGIPLVFHSRFFMFVRFTFPLAVFFDVLFAMSFTILFILLMTFTLPDLLLIIFMCLCAVRFICLFTYLFTLIFSLCHTLHRSFRASLCVTCQLFLGMLCLHVFSPSSSCFV